jgi:predicted dinucleotide-binding enzyme
MRIGVIGSGKIGGTVARLAAAAGHEVAIANSRGPESVEPLAAEIGAKARAATVDEAAHFGVVILVAVPLMAIEELPASEMAGRIVIDAMNYYPNRDGHIAELDSDELTSSELTARHLHRSRVVKSFNTMRYTDLAERGDRDADYDDRLAMYIAGDDEDAKMTVAGLIDEFGFAPLDVGNLRDGGRQLQPGSPVYAESLTLAEAKTKGVLAWR